MSLHPDTDLIVIDLTDESHEDATAYGDPPRPLPRVLPEPIGFGGRHYPGEFLG